MPKGLYGIPRHPSFYEKYPDEALHLLINILNSKNLEDLLSYCSFTSIFDFYDTLEFGSNIFAPLINIEQINVLTQASLRSKSKMYKDRTIQPADINSFYNYWINIMGFRMKRIENSEELERAGDREAIAVLNSQFRFQDNGLIQRNVRSYVQYFDIPSRFESELQAKLQKSYVSIPDEFKKWAGIPIADLLNIGLFVLSVFYKFFKKIYPDDESRNLRTELQKRYGDLRLANNNPINANLTNEKIDFLFLKYSEHKQYMSFINLSPVVIKDANFHSAYQSFVNLLSKNFEDLRRMAMYDEPYQNGIILDRLCPLERYPIVQINPNKYVIPNIRYFSFSITESIHYFLQEKYENNEFNQTMGLIQEKYIYELLSILINPTDIICEFEYKREKENVRSADFLIILENLILIESKLKRPTALLRADPGSDTFCEEMKSINVAFSKALDKIEDLRKGICSLEHIQHKINSSLINPPLIIVVIGDGFENPMNVLRYHVKYCNFGNLKKYPYKFLLLNVSSLEKMIALAYETKTSLNDVFRKHSVDKNSVLDEIGSTYQLDKELSFIKPHNLPYFKQKMSELEVRVNELHKYNN